MIDSVQFAPPFSIIFVSDNDFGDDPDIERRHVAWTDRAIAITCLNYQDGVTKVTLKSFPEVERSDEPVVDRTILTPAREVIVSTVELAVVLRASVASTRTRVRIWENHPTEPDDIVIGLG